MKNIKFRFFAIICSALLMSFTVYAQDSSGVKNTEKEIKKENQHGRMFIDKNGDGYNDNAPDHDGDGIPNGLDPDYLKLSKKRKFETIPYADLDGDGINDNLQLNNKFRGNGLRPNHGIAPQNGNSQGKGNNSSQGQGNQKGKGSKK